MASTKKLDIKPIFFNSSTPAFVIGICGPPTSGKTRIANNIMASVKDPWVAHFSMCQFYKVLTDADLAKARKYEYNFDQPEAFDMELLLKALTELKRGLRVKMPIYNMKTYQREKRTETQYGPHIVIIEGILPFHDPEILKLIDLKVYIDTALDTCLVRRLDREISVNGKDLGGVLTQYLTLVKPGYSKYIQPAKHLADIIVPHPWTSQQAMDKICNKVSTEMCFRFYKLLDAPASKPMPFTLVVLPANPMITQAFNFFLLASTTQTEFIFFTNRLFRLILERCMIHFQWQMSRCRPTGPFRRHQICGISTWSAGSLMEKWMDAVAKGIHIGKIVIRKKASGEPKLHSIVVPTNVKDYQVLLCDAFVHNCEDTVFAINVLLSHGVRQENIVLAAIIMSEVGVREVARNFPGVRMVTTYVETSYFYKDQRSLLEAIQNFTDNYKAPATSSGSGKR